MSHSNGSNCNLNHSVETHDKHGSLKKLNHRKKGESSKEIRTLFMNKDDDSTSAINQHKKSPYVATFKKLKRKVRNKTYSVSEPHSSQCSLQTIKPPTSGNNRNSEQNDDITNSIEILTLPTPSAIPNSLPGTPKRTRAKGFLKNNTASIAINVYDEDDLSYSYEESDSATQVQEENSYNQTEKVPSEYEVEIPPFPKEEESEKSYIYVDMKELFERPSFYNAINLAGQETQYFSNVTDKRERSEATSSNTQSAKHEHKEAVPQITHARLKISSGRFQYSDPLFPSLMQDSIRELALDGQFADVTIEVEECRMKCHRMILAASSEYFKAMFCNPYIERDQPSVKIQEVSADVMKVLIRYAYTSYLEIDCDNVQSVLEAASLLQFTRVMAACCDYFISELSIENAPGIMELSHRHNLNNLLTRATVKCVENFEELREKSDYIVLTGGLLESLISRKDLIVSAEEEVYKVVMSWCEHSPEDRKQHLPKLLQHVKLPLLDPVFFVREVETHSFIQNNPDVFDLMMEARLYRVSGVPPASERVVPRNNLNTHQVFVTVGGCNKDDSFVFEVSMMDFQHKTRAVLCRLPSESNSVRNSKAQLDGAAEKKGLKWTEFACTAWKGNIVVSGGKETKNETWMFITSIRQWVELDELITGRWRHRMVVCKGELYAVGGYDGLLRVDSLEKYNERENSWYEKQVMKEGVSSAAVCECFEKIFVMGGGPSIKVSTEKVQVYDPSTDRWELTTPMPEAAKCINAVSLRGIIYVVGGTLTKILSFDPLNNVWSQVGEALPSERASCGITICNNLVFIVGGRDDTGKAISNVSYFDPTTSKIHSECNLAYGLSHHGCITLEKYDHTRAKQV